MDVERGRSVPEPPGFHVMHWHEDFQFIYVFTGEIYLHTLEQTKIISAGQGIFLNKGVVHLVSASLDCHYKSFLFPEYLVSFYPGCPASKYVKRISNCEQITFIELKPSIPWQKEALDNLKRLSALDSSTATCYEYEILSLLTALWLALTKNLSIPDTSERNLTAERMQIFLQYIQKHYSEDLTLEDLANSAGVSKSECLRCFKISMQDTPYHYLLEYRLQVAADLLTTSAFTVGEIAQAVGFQSQSHFGKLFKKQTGYSPRDFRAKQK